MSQPSGRRVVIFGPALFVEVSVESGVDESPEIHVHAGGQGYWIARMVDTLGGLAQLCSPVGGELGVIVRAALFPLSADGLIEVDQPTSGRIVDRRDAQGRTVDGRSPEGAESFASSHPVPLDRHAVDNLFTRTLGLAVGAGCAVIAGTNGDGSIPVGTFERLAKDLGAAETRVVADVSGDELRAVLGGGGETIVKVSDAELIDDGWAPGGSPEDLVAGSVALRDAGAVSVLVTSDSGRVTISDSAGTRHATGPRLSAVNPNGAGDSFTAAVATVLASSGPLDQAVRLGVAAGALNATRHGLGSGERDAIESLAEKVRITEDANG